MELETRIGYDMKGDEVDSEHWSCVAKYVQADGRDKYFVKHFLGTGFKHKMIQVHSPHFELSSLRQKGEIMQSIDFRTVSKFAFDNYLKYLKTKNEVFLQNAMDPFGE